MRPALSGLAGTLAAIAMACPVLAQSPAPAFKAGESWTYNEINGYNNEQRATIVREIVSAEGTVRITTRTGEGKPLDDAVWSAPGDLAAGAVNDRARGRFEPPLQMRPFPLTEGQRWTQRVTRADDLWKERRQTRIDGRALGWETVRVPMGEFRALKIRRVIHVGDQDPFRSESTREEIEWYVPELKMPVKLTVREFYRDDPYDLMRSILPGDWYHWELTSAKVAR